MRETGKFLAPLRSNYTIDKVLVNLDPAVTWVCVAIESKYFHDSTHREVEGLAVDRAFLDLLFLDQ